MLDQSTWFSFSFIDAAHADSGMASFGGFDLMGLLPFVVIFVAFYFLLIRPQQKKAQQQRDMINTLQKGERVVTAGGIIGKIVSVDNNQEVVLEIEDGGKLRMLKTAISDRISSTSTGSSADSKVTALKSVSEEKQNQTIRKKPTQKVKTQKSDN